MNNVNVRNLKGERGASVVASGNQVEGVFCALQCISDTTFGGVIGNYDNTQGTINGVVIPGGTTLYGKFTTVPVTTGLVVAYNDI